MTRLSIGTNTELLIQERSLGVPAVLLGLAAGLNLFFWLRARSGARSVPTLLGLLLGSLAAGLAAVGGAVWLAGQAHPALGWLCAGVVLIAIIFTSYFWGTQGAATGGALLLLILRILAVGTLAVLYFEPTVKFVNRRVERSKLLVLLDTSGSMKVNDGPNGLSRLDWVKSELAGGTGALARLREDFQLELYSFSDRLDRIEPRALGDLKPQGPATTLAPTVGSACSKSDKLSAAGALVFTDGIDNSGRDPVDEIARAGLPVYPVAVGSKLREKGDFKDIAVTRVDCERYIAADNRTEVTAHVEAVGLNGRRVSVILRFDGKERDRQPLVLDDFPGTQSVKLAFTPDKKGTFKCAVEVSEDPEERITDNNRQEFDVIVTDPAIKVLIVEGVPKPDYKFLIRTLQMDPNVSLIALIRVTRDRFIQEGIIKDVQMTGFPTDYETLKKFNVLIFGDIDRTAFTTEQLKNVQRLVESGGGFLMTGGFCTLGPGGYGGTPIDDIVPVRLGEKDIGQEKDPFELKLASDGAAHPIFSGIAPFFRTPDGAPARHLPPLDGCTRVGAPRPGASVLATHPSRTGPDGSPLTVAAVQRYGRGRTMVFTAAGTWHWYFQLRGLGRDTPYIKFWGQVIRWLAGQEVKELEEKPGLVAYTDRRLYEPGATVRIYAQARDQHGQAANQANVTALISGPAGSPSSRQIPYLTGSPGKYEVDFAPPSPGEYKMLVKADTAAGPIGTAELDFRVGRPNLEFDRLDLNDDLLKRMADKTGGRYVTLVGLGHFIDTLRSQEQAKSTITDVNVWSDRSLHVLGQRISPYLLIAFLVFCGLLTAEWVLRKRKQLL